MVALHLAIDGGMLLPAEVDCLYFFLRSGKLEDGLLLMGCA